MATATRDRGGRETVAVATVTVIVASAASATGTAGLRRPPLRPANGVPSFEDAFEAELVSELGDLGPGAVEAEGRSSSGGDRRPPRGRSRRR